MITAFLEHIVSVPSLHGRWLNTLSFLENCGARKIASGEHRTEVTLDKLQHAAEEFRHAFLLKKQICRVSPEPLETYALSSMLGSFQALHYLDKLDLSICRLLKSKYGTKKQLIKQVAYLLVTYAIEVRASILYPLYQSVLQKYGIKVSLRALIAEEDRHLADIVQALSQLSHSVELMKHACQIEEKLFENLLRTLIKNQKDAC